MTCDGWQQRHVPCDYVQQTSAVGYHINVLPPIPAHA